MTAVKRLGFLGVPGGSFWTPSYQNQTVDASNDGVAFVFRAINAEAINGVAFRYGARTGTPPTLRASLQPVDTGTGNPSGTPLGGATPASATFTPPASAAWDGLVQWVALANSYTPARGEVIALCIEYSSGTIDASNNSTFTYQAANGLLADNVSAPYALTLTAGVWAHQTRSPIFGVRTASSRYGLPLQAAYTTSVTTSGHRQALKFALNSGWGDTFKVIGMRVYVDPPATGNTFKIGIWDAGGVIQDATIDVDQLSNQTVLQAELYFDEVSLTALSYGTTYYAGIEATGAATILRGINVSATEDLETLGGDFYLSTYNGASWADTNTTRPLVELILDDITEPAGGAGGYVIGA